MGRDVAAMRAAMAGGAEDLATVAAKVQPTVLARAQRLPVLPALEPLIPGGGLRRGSTLSVDGLAATSLALAAAAGPSQDGAWVAAVGFPSLGLLAAAELGIALDRLVLVAEPEPLLPGERADAASWPSVVAALVDAFEVVLVHASDPVRAADGRRLVARTRERGAVLVQVGGSRATGAVWPEGADVALRVVDAAGRGWGRGTVTCAPAGSRSRPAVGVRQPDHVGPSCGCPRSTARWSRCCPSPCPSAPPTAAASHDPHPPQGAAGRPAGQRSRAARRGDPCDGALWRRSRHD